MKEEHNFVETKYPTEKYHRVIYCTKCGKVAWDFNDPMTIEKHQGNIKGCFSSNQTF